ncbi:MAG: transglutaminase-like domain-containing protein [Mariniblastus sp.]|nr:transglutaminase-like domain-containing protein [Mariniblastus sp.]
MNRLVSRLAILICLAAVVVGGQGLWLPALQGQEGASGQEEQKTKPALAGKQDGFGGTGPSLLNPVKYNWRVGVQIKAGRSPASNFLVTIPIPVNWPEQRVELLEQDVPEEIRSVKQRSLNSGVQQLVIDIPRIKANRLVELSMIYQVTVGHISGPKQPASLKISKKPPREAKEYLGVGPQISYRNSKLRAQVKKLISEPENDWEKIEAIFDWVRSNIELVDGDEEDSIHTFRQRQGCAEDLVGLFVAMCRAAKVPARVVWVEGHSYAEFMLVDEQGEHHWFPAQVAGLRQFGSMNEPRIILQKGDNIKVPEKELRQKFVAEFVKGSGQAKPKVRFIREMLPAGN